MAGDEIRNSDGEIIYEYNLFIKGGHDLMMGYGGYGYGMMGYGWGWVMMIGMFVLVVVGILALLRYIRNPIGLENKSLGVKPLEILDVRYAKGELSDEEYQKMKSEILRNN